MFRCKAVNFLYSAVPLRSWRSLLIRRHLENCPRCQATLANREEARSLLVQEDKVGGVERLWPAISEKLRQEDGQELAQPALVPSRWNYAVVAVAFLVVAAVSLLLLRGLRPADIRPDMVRPLERFELEYIKVGGEPANAYVYQPHGSDMVIVWAEKSMKGGL